jgi:hypothetical protein
MLGREIVLPEAHHPGQQLFVRACHNAGHALACAATGKDVPPLDLEPCRRDALGLHRVPDKTSTALIGWTGPAAEAIASTYAGATDEAVASWMWSRYRNTLPLDAVPCDCAPITSDDPTILTVALAIASANWADIKRLARALVDAHSIPTASVHHLGPTTVLDSIDTTRGFDIGTPFSQPKTQSRRRPNRWLILDPRAEVAVYGAAPGANDPADVGQYERESQYGTIYQALRTRIEADGLNCGRRVPSIAAL